MVSSFPAILSGGDKTAIRAGQYNATPYLLYNPKNIVFQAQVDQASFNTVFATVDFDNINTGVIADALSGFTVYIGDIINDIRSAEFVGRCRAGSTGSTLNINETSAIITDGQYIMVVKDVAINEILGLYVNKVMKTDWDISFRQLLPRVTGLDSCYVGVLVGGVADFTFPAVGKATTTGAAISSWLWDADGGTFINGTADTDAQPDIRYNAAGVYWPRVTVTDDNGLEGWFTMPVFVLTNFAPGQAKPADDFIVTGFEGLSISSQLATGQVMRFNYSSDELGDVVDQTFIALWVVDDYAGSAAPILNEIAFVGRMRREDPKHKTDVQSGVLPETPFVCEGILGQLGRIRSPQLGMTFDAAPAEFQEINNMTQWRMASFILTEFSTVANVCSLLFDVEDDTYLNREDSTDNTSLLAAINGLLAARKAALNQSSTGQLYGARNANFMTTAQRNALDTITTFTTNDTFSNSITIDQANAIGQITAYAGGYNSTDNTLRILRAAAPAIASNAGQGIGSPVNGILLASDATLAAQMIEIEQIVADALADANPKDQPKPEILAGYWFLMPTNFQWYGYLMSINENNRGIVYDATDRFLLTSMNISFDTQLSSWTIDPTLSHETKGGGSQTLSQVQPGAIPLDLPSIPTFPAYPGFPPLPGLWTPPGSIIIPPLAEADGDALSQLDILTLQGEVGVWWDATEVFVAQDVASNIMPTWNSKFTVSGAMAIKDVKFSPHDTGMYVMVNDGSNNSKLWYTANVFASIPSWTSTTFSDINYTTIRTSSTPDRIYIFGIDDRTTTVTVNLLDGNGRVGLTPSPRTSPLGGSSHSPGSYDTINDWYQDDGSLAIGGGKACDIEYDIPGGMLLQTAGADFEGARPNAILGGERRNAMSLDGVVVTTLDFSGGFYAAGSVPGSGRLSKNFGGVTGSTLLFHCSMDMFSGGALVRFVKIDITMTATGNGQAAYRLSDDNGASFGNLYKTASQISPASEPGFDSGAADDFAYLAGSAIILDAENEEAIATKTGGASAGTLSKAIWAYGTNPLQDIIFATDVSFGGITMSKIIDDTPVDITPNDGVDDGFVNSRNGICMSRVSDEHMWFVGTFGANTKFAYTADGGATPWTISAETLTSFANYIRVKDSGLVQVYIIDTGILKYSKDGGVNFLTDRVVPNDFGIGFEVR